MVCGASLGSAGESRAVAAAQLCCPRAGTVAVLLPWGWGQGRKYSVPLCCEPNEAIRLSLLLKNQMVVQTIRQSFHFYTCLSCLVYAKV